MIFLISFSWLESTLNSKKVNPSKRFGRVCWSWASLSAIFDCLKSSFRSSVIDFDFDLWMSSTSSSVESLSWIVFGLIAWVVVDLVGVDVVVVIIWSSSDKFVFTLKFERRKSKNENVSISSTRSQNNKQKKKIKKIFSLLVNVFETIMVLADV